MNFDPTWLFLSLIPGGIGTVLFIYGKKQQRWPHLAAGVLLMVYPYFVSSFTSMLVIGVVITSAVWLATRMGW